MVRRLAVIGHPLAAEENRMAFRDWKGFHVDLIVPRIWKSRSLGHTYHFPESSGEKSDADTQPSLHALDTLAGGRNSLFLWLGLSALLRSLRPDIIYCWEEPWCLSTRQIIRLARNLDVPLVFYSAENRPKKLPWPFSALQTSAFQACAGCIVPTGEIAARIRATGYSGRVFTVPLWIRSRRMLASQASSRRLVYVGRLIALKRVHLLIESLVKLPDFRLRIIGDGPERTSLENLARESGLEERVEFRGHVDNGNLEAALEGASLLILPTGENARQAEQFGKAALEGVSCGLPVLASLTGNLALLAGTVPTLTGRDLDTASQMADAISGIFRAYPDPETLEKARAQVQETYGPMTAGVRLEAAFSSLLSSYTLHSSSRTVEASP